MIPIKVIFWNLLQRQTKMEQFKYQDRFHQLKFQYTEFLKRQKDISKSKIGKYYIEQKINNSQYGIIFLGKDIKTETKVAAKILDLEQIQRQSSTQMKKIRRRLSESQAKLMMVCQSAHLVKCFDVYQNQSLRIIIMEYCNGKNLQAEIQQRGRIPEKEAIIIMRQIILGLCVQQYHKIQMHNHRIIHRDLKGCNILSHNGIYKICDFGFAKEMKEGLVTTCLGTVSTMALEVLQLKPYGIKADIWSLGVIFFQMVFGKLPYASRTPTSMREQLQNNSIKFTQKQFTFNNYTASTEVTNFLRQILVVDPSGRLDSEALLNHSIFHQNIDPSLILSASNLSKLHQTASLVYLGSQIEKLFSNITEIQTSNRQAIKILYRQDQNIYNGDRQKWIQQSFLQLSKTEFIFYQIVEKIMQNNLLDITNRDVAEMIFLMVTRGLNNLTIIKEKIKSITQQQSIQNLQRNVEILYREILAKHNQYSSNLTNLENQIISIIYDKFLKIFSSESIIMKDIFLTGMELFDYKKQQQIDYTYNEYIKVLLQSIPEKQGVNISRIKGYMKYYIEINKITLEEYQQSRLGFREFIAFKIFK